METKRLQNRIAESRWLLPTMMPIAVVIWATVGILDHNAIVPLLCLFFSTYLMMELNNSNALIRIYSRIVSSAFLAMTTMATFQFSSTRAAIVVLCSVGYYTTAFRCYQDTESPGWTFYSFLCIGLCSVVWVQSLFFVPLLWIVMRTNLLAMSLRSFVSSIFGLIFPNLFLTAYYIVLQQPERLIEHFTDMAVFQSLFNYSILSINQIITLGLVLLCAFIGIPHVLLQRRRDNIRTRLLHQIFITIDIAAIVFIVLQPQHYEILLGIIIVSTSPLIGHYIALTHSKLSDITFRILAVLTLVLTAYNLWTFLPTFF